MKGGGRGGNSAEALTGGAEVRPEERWAAQRCYPQTPIYAEIAWVYFEESGARAEQAADPCSAEEHCTQACLRSS